MKIIHNNIIIDTYKYEEKENKIIVEYKVKDGYTHLELNKKDVTILEED